MTHVSYLYIFILCQDKKKMVRLTRKICFAIPQYFLFDFQRVDDFAYVFDLADGRTLCGLFHPVWDDMGDNDDLSLISRFLRNESCFQKYTFGGGGTNEIFVLAFQWDYERFLRVVHV